MFLNAPCIVYDFPTLRFYYNLGHEYFSQLKAKYGSEAVHSLAVPDEYRDQAYNNDNEITHLTNEMNTFKIDKDCPSQVRRFNF